MRLSLLSRKKAASGIDYAVLMALVVVAAIGAVALTGDRMRTLFVATDETVGNGIAGLPIAGGGAGGGSPPPAESGEGLWSGDGTFALDPFSSPETRLFSLTNIGTGLLTLGSPAISGTGAAFFEILGSTCSGALPPGDSCEVLVQAWANANGTATATLSIADVPGGIVLSRMASGFDPALAWSGGGAFVIDGTPGPEPLPRTAQQTFTLRNQGFADATGVAPAISGPDADAFSLSHDCPATLPAAGSCTITVTATAEANGSLVATLVAGGPASEDQILTAIASGFAPLFTWSGGGAFTVTAPTTNPEIVQQVFTLTNIGTAPGIPPSPSVSGDAAGYTLAVSATDCGASSLPVGGTCEVTVTATFTDDVTTLTGTLAAGPATQALTGSASGFGPRLTFVMGAMESGWDITAGPFRRTGVFTITNTGLATSGPVAPGAVSIAVSGPAIGAITDNGTCTGQTLSSGASCTIGVEIFGLDNGPYTAVVSTALHGGATGAIAGAIANYNGLNLTISANTFNYHLAIEAYNAGWTGGRPIVLTVQSGVVVGSTSTEQPALNIQGFPHNSSIILINNGIIAGAGGRGASYSHSSQSGGMAMFVGSPVTVFNNGIIGGGGGGGGRGHGSGSARGGGGGGGAGALPGPASNGVPSGGGICGASGGSAGSLLTGGAGGSSICGSRGGKGGDLGQPGLHGEGPGGIGGSTPGAEPGAAVRGNSFITWKVVGDRRGPLIHWPW